jgi:hypothetical protein
VVKLLTGRAVVVIAAGQTRAIPRCYRGHDHEEDEVLITSSRVFNEAKGALRNDPTRPIKRTFDEAITNIVNTGYGYGG